MKLASAVASFNLVYVKTPARTTVPKGIVYLVSSAAYRCKIILDAISGKLLLPDIDVELIINLLDSLFILMISIIEIYYMYTKSCLCNNIKFYSLISQKNIKNNSFSLCCSIKINVLFNFSSKIGLEGLIKCSDTHKVLGQGNFDERSVVIRVHEECKHNVQTKINSEK